MPKNYFYLFSLFVPNSVTLNSKSFDNSIFLIFALRPLIASKVSIPWQKEAADFKQKFKSKPQIVYWPSSFAFALAVDNKT